MIAKATKTPDRGDLHERLRLIGELLQQFAWPVSTAYIRREISTRHGRDWSKQTVLRDLELYVEIGVVALTSEARGHSPARWRWIGSAPATDSPSKQSA